MSVEKGALRRALIAWRENLDTATRAQAERAISALLIAELAAVGARRVSAYWPIRGEPDLGTAWQRLHAAGHVLALPVVVARDAPLTFRRWDGAVPRARDAAGVPSAEGPPLDAVDAIVVPCVGVDARGYRLGYGGGYFDRTLAALSPRPRTIGIAFEGQCRGFDVQPHDVRLDVLVTEARVMRFD